MNDNGRDGGERRGRDRWGELNERKRERKKN
jgi:hypothetical protein